MGVVDSLVGVVDSLVGVFDSLVGVVDSLVGVVDSLMWVVDGIGTGNLELETGSVFKLENWKSGKGSEINSGKLEIQILEIWKLHL